ncbi:hypothetical protein EDD29_8123 [Actinocorallia herbida]|uniref:Spore-associated protein A n=1 Tax=Actinocorallia herbida TaxID=58109 RepID=A0A3N1DBB0_9ACTN|nr:spore-associated protein A [Actinocorallia herbida]ROO90398.1 hypothetical protein EDD29_8123 [Actinocorallia herbida]
MSVLKKTLAAGAMTVAATAGVVTISTAAYAEAYCGSGYGVVASAPVQNQYGDTWGRVYLTYNSSTGKNCVTTVKSAFVGTASFTSAQLMIQNGNSYYDQGYYVQYAGPLYGSAAGKCVMYWGSVTNPSNTIGAGGGRMSWGNCG